MGFYSQHSYKYSRNCSLVLSIHNLYIFNPYTNHETDL